MTTAVLIDVVRTASAKGKAGGALSEIHASDLYATVLQALIERTGIDPVLVDDVITGCVLQARDQAGNIARYGLLSAGFPSSVPGTTIDRQCGSSLQALQFAAQGIIAGGYDIVIAGGVESMSRVPMGTNRMGVSQLGRLGEARYPEGLVSQGISAELVADKWGFSRRELDVFSAESHRRAAAAAPAFAREIVPVTLPDGSVFDTDETVRAGTSEERLAALPTPFATEAARERFPEIDWKITAGNSSPLTDGASAALLMSEEMADRLGLRPRARFVSFSVVGDDPLLMLTGPIPASRKVLAKAGLSIDDMDAYELNEAFAPVPLAWSRELGADPAKLNPRGGAIALGHPMGASGTRLLATMLSYLEDTSGRYGLEAICEGGGMANAMIIERI